MKSRLSRRTRQLMIIAFAACLFSALSASYKSINNSHASTDKLALDCTDPQVKSQFKLNCKPQLQEGVVFETSGLF